MEVEELASMCIAAMIRKRPNDPIKYEGKREKTTFESKYLAEENEEEEDLENDDTVKTKNKNPKH